MSYQFTISDIGLRLIKAYEGYRPEPRALEGGGQVIGFGHSVDSDDVSSLSEEDAETTLKADLAPIEDLINSHVHASMTQSQFDALCSLVFSIGEKAFMSSNILHAMNKGQVIEAANGFDLWRKGNIDGQVYVVDALVRRRTAEKALFLRPTQRTARAPRYELTAIKDTNLANSDYMAEVATLTETDSSEMAFDLRSGGSQHSGIDTEPEKKNEIDNDIGDTKRRGLSTAPTPVLYSEDDEDIQDVDDFFTTPIDPVVELVTDDKVMDLDMVAAPPTGALAETFVETVEPHINEDMEPETVTDIISDIVEEDTQEITDIVEEAITSITDDDDTSDIDLEETVTHSQDDDDASPIAAAAAEVSDRLDALIDEPIDTQTEWPESLITPSSPSDSSETDESDTSVSDTQPADVIIDELHKDDALREQVARDSQYNTDRYVEYVSMDIPNARNNLWAFFTMMIVGLTITLAGLGINLKGSVSILGDHGPFITVLSMLIGALLFIGGAYYLMKSLFVRD